MSEGGPGISVRSLLFAGVFVLALALRLGQLGAMPLNDGEAAEALWAAAGTPEQSAFWPTDGASAPSSAVYQSATWLIFQFGGAGEAAARALPALVGALIVVPPWLMRRRLGVLGALLTSLLLAISPTLVASSRLAGGASAALVAVALGAAAIVLFLDGDLDPRRAVALLAGCVAVGLASGPAFFFGLVGIGGAAALMRVSAPRPWAPGDSAALRRLLGQAFAIGAAAAVVIALAAGWLPSGATSLAEGARRWLIGWISPAEMNALSPVVILVAYEPLVLVFGIFGAVKAFRERDALRVGAAWWALLSLTLALVYSGRTGVVVAWCVVPLAWLAGAALAAEAERIWPAPTSPRSTLGVSEVWQSLIVGGVLLFLLVYAGLQLASYVSGVGPGFAQLNPELRLTVAAGAVVIAAVAAVLIGFGWSWSVARAGSVLAGAAALLILTLASGWRLNYMNWEDSPGELWAASAPTRGLTRLTSTVASLSMTSRGNRHELPIAIEDPAAPPSLIWALRAFPRFTASDSGLPESPPVRVMRDVGLAPSFAADYLGQSITLIETPDYDGLLPPDWLGWWWGRRLPVEQSSWLLFVRADVATQGEAELSVAEPSEGEP